MQQIIQSQSSEEHQNPWFKSYSNNATKKNPKKLIECVICQRNENPDDKK